MKDNHFYAIGREVFQRPTEKVNEDGTISHSMGFLVCTVSEWVKEEQAAELIAAAMNAYDNE